MQLNFYRLLSVVDVVFAFDCLVVDGGTYKINLFKFKNKNFVRFTGAEFDFGLSLCLVTGRVGGDWGGLGLRCFLYEVSFDTVLFSFEN